MQPEKPSLLDHRLRDTRTKTASSCRSICPSNGEVTVARTTGGCCRQKGPWTPEEDKLLVDYIQKNKGHGNWRRLSKLAGLNRCEKSCRLRWNNYLRPDIKRGRFTDDEEKLIIHLHSILGNKWSSISTKLPSRTDNDIKNYWNTHLRKKLLNMGIDPVTHRPRTDINILSAPHNLLAAVNLGSSLAAAMQFPAHITASSWDSNALKLHADAAKYQLLHGLVSTIAAAATPGVDLMALLAASNNAGLAGVDQGTSMVQYEGPLNMLGFTTVPTVSPQGMLDGGVGGALAGDGLGSTELDPSGAAGSNMAPPPLVAHYEECNAGICNNVTTCCDEETLAFEGLENLNLDDDLTNNDTFKDFLLE